MTGHTLKDLLVVVVVVVFVDQDIVLCHRMAIFLLLFFALFPIEIEKTWLSFSFPFFFGYCDENDDSRGTFDLDIVDIERNKTRQSDKIKKRKNRIKRP